MPALGQIAINDRGPAPARVPVKSAKALPAVEMRPDRCPCGQRRPMGVLLGMRSGARPRLEGTWYCRKNCLETALRERARRDWPEAVAPSARVRHRIPLGLLLQARGVISADTLRLALERQGTTGRRIGQVLLEDFAVPESRITHAVAAQWGLPMLHLPKKAAMPLAHLAPAELFAAAGCLPLDVRHGRLLLGTTAGADAAIALALERMHNLQVDFGVIGSSEFERWREASAVATVPMEITPCANRDAMAKHATGMLLRLQPVESRVVRVGPWWWMRLWLEPAAQGVEGMLDDVRDVLYTPEKAEVLRAGMEASPLAVS